MLKQRIITALILAPIAIGGIFFLSPMHFSWFIGLVVVLGAWEWANLSGFEAPVARIGFAAVVAVLLALIDGLPAFPVLILAALWWVAAFFLVLRYPANTQLWQSPPARLVIGLLVLLPTWKALVVIRHSALASYPDVNNLWVILYVMLLVWSADVGAYFAGRAWGKAKLAPKVSPGKSWAGAYGGLAATVVLAFLGAWFLEANVQDMTLLVTVTVITAVFSILGDLLESMLKRHRGIKDSSNLLPGHGGVLDRIDSLTAAIPVFTLLLILTGWLQ